MGRAPKKDFLEEKLARSRGKGLYRELPRPLPEGHLDLRSNDHLGLTQSAPYQEKLKEAFQASPLVGSTGSRLISGNSGSVEQLESEVAEFYRDKASLLFPSGYQANVGLLSAIGEKGSFFLYDERIHASMRDGIRLSFARSRSFRHNDPSDLEEQLRKMDGPCSVLTEGLFSMDGDLPPLKEFLELCERHGAELILDEAHSNGLYGPNGEGVAVQEGMEERIFARVMPFGKAFSQQGAAVLGSSKLREFLINQSRPFIYSTAPSYPLLVALSTSLQEVRDAGPKRKELFRKAEHFRDLASKAGLPVLPDAFGPVQGIFVKDNEKVMELEASLWEKGFAVKGIRSPSVPEGEERLRIMIHADTPEKGIEALLERMKELL